MNRLFLILVLTFTTVTFFANEKTEVLPVENNVETSDFSMEEKLLMRQINKIHAGGLLLGTATTVFNICTVTNVALLVDSLSISSIILSGTLTGISTAYLLGALISGSVLLSSGIKKFHASSVALEKIQPFIAKKLVKLKRASIISGVICSVSGVMTLTGIGLICSSVINPYCGIFGNIFTFIGSGCVFSTLPVMITSLAMSAWLKGQTNRLSVDIGVTSGSTGELSCDKKRNALEKPTGVALALSVKF